MKNKMIALAMTAVFGCVALSGCTWLVGETEKDEKPGETPTIDATTDVSKIPTETVTEAEWKAAFAKENFKNFTIYSPGLAEGDDGDPVSFEQTTYYAENGCMFVAQSEGKPFADGTLDVAYWSEQDAEGVTQYYQYEHNGSNGGWTRSTIDEEQFTGGMQFVYEAYCNGMIYSQIADKFADATYNEAGGYYGLTITLLGGEQSYSYDARLKFMGGKIFAFGGQTPTPFGPQGELQYAKIYAYGTTVVTPPQV